MTFKTLLAAAVCGLLAAGAQAQHYPERSPLEIGEDYIETTVAFAPDVEARPDGTPRALYRIDYPVAAASPEAMAREFLAAYAEALRLASPDLADLRHVYTRSGQAGHSVRFFQTVGDVTVYGSEIAVNVDPRNRVQLVFSRYQPALAVETTPQVTAAEARAAVTAHLDAAGAFALDETELVVYPTADEAYLAWHVRLAPDAPRGDWEAFVDARTGALLRVADRTIYERGWMPSAPTTAPAPAPEAATPVLLRRVDATGMIFDPDPLTRAGVPYGTAGYVDGGDATTPQLDAARTAVTLRDVTFDGTLYHLQGPWAYALDWDSPASGIFSQPAADWSFTRDAGAFEWATTYWQIDNYMRYLNITLGVTVDPHQYSTGVQFDAHGWNGADNSSYSGGTGRLTFGEGCVDDAEDADVILHELGHGIHHWLQSPVGGGPSNADGLSEGTGDYIAASYARLTGLLTVADPEWNWVFKWDGHNPCWPGRVTNFGGVYPSGTAPHSRGQHWATALSRIQEDIGLERGDRAAFEGLGMTTSSATQPQAAQAVMQAAVNMGYTPAELAAMEARFDAKGYNVTIPPVAADPGTEAPGSYALSVAYPNPFNPQANFTLRVGQAQQVRVALYDALGREVRVLHEGALTAGIQHAFTVDGAGLPSGLYVIRATGETFSASRPATLVK